MGASKAQGTCVSQIRLPDDIDALYRARRDEIRARLADFALIDRSQWFYECCFCILTPQSSAVHADAVVTRLREESFYEHGHDVLHHLRNPEAYIRFHTTKHGRLHALRDNWQRVEELLTADIASERERRNKLADTVLGYGLKEASHAMRNIGFRGVAILDRHLLRLLVRCGVYDEIPAVGTRKAYWKVEEAFMHYAEHVGIDMDELDLLFWCAMTGHILK